MLPLTHLLDVHYTPGQARTCCGRNSKGVAIQGDRLYLATIDTHLIAIDTKTGREIWTTKSNRLTRHSQRLFIYALPLVVKDKVILGPAGGEYGIRAMSQRLMLKPATRNGGFHVIPNLASPATKRGRRLLDSWRRIDLDAGQLRSGTQPHLLGNGNAGPDWNGDPRPGDNFYTCSVVALDADTADQMALPIFRAR